MRPKGDAGVDDRHEFSASEPTAPPPGLIGARSEAFLGLVLEHMAEGVMTLDALGRITYVNHVARERYPFLRPGLSVKELARAQALYAADGRIRVPLAATPMARVMRGETINEAEYVVRDGSGQALPFRVSGGPFLEGGRVMGGVLVFADLAEQKRSEQAARASDTWLRGLAANVPATIVVSDRAHRVLYVNRRPTGCDPDGVLGQDMGEFVGLEDRAAFLGALDEVLRAGQPRRVEVRGVGGPTETRWYGISIGPIHEEGRVVALVSVILDDTEKHAAEERYRAQEAVLAEAEENVAMGSWSFDFTTGKTHWSRGMYRMLGEDPGSPPLGLEQYVAMFDPAWRDRQLAEVERVLAAPRPFVHEHHMIRRDGAARVFRVSGRPVPAAGQPPRRMTGVVQDITEQHQAERAKSEFVAIVSHELRTPLTTIRAPLLMLQCGMLDPRDPAGRAIVDIAVESVERMTRLVNDIFDYDRLETGRLTVRREPVDVAEVAARAVDAMRGEAERGGIRLTLAAEPVQVAVDRDRVVQVLTNLLDNALKFSAPGEAVRVAVVPREGGALVTVSDEGPGIAAEHLEAIFERFHQVDNAPTRHMRGTGLGLAIARHIVQLHGGRIWAASEPGAGSTFSFTLPGASSP